MAVDIAVLNIHTELATNRLPDGPLQHVLKQQLYGSGAIVELGTGHGLTSKLIASNLHDDRILHTFDWFQGRPEEWRDRYGAGQHDRKGLSPRNLPPNIIVHPGLFEETLPSFVQENPKIALLFVDCESYSSTSAALSILAPSLHSGSVIVFNQFINYEGYENHELKAFVDFLERYDKSYHTIGMYGKILKPKKRRNSDPGNQKAAFYVYNSDKFPGKPDTGVPDLISDILSSDNEDVSSLPVAAEIPALERKKTRLSLSLPNPFKRSSKRDSNKLDGILEDSTDESAASDTKSTKSGKSSGSEKKKRWSLPAMPNPFKRKSKAGEKSDDAEKSPATQPLEGFLESIMEEAASTAEDSDMVSVTSEKKKRLSLPTLRNPFKRKTKESQSPTAATVDPDLAVASGEVFDMEDVDVSSVSSSKSKSELKEEKAAKKEAARLAKEAAKMEKAAKEAAKEAARLAKKEAAKMEKTAKKEAKIVAKAEAKDAKKRGAELAKVVEADLVPLSAIPAHLTPSMTSGSVMSLTSKPGLESESMNELPVMDVDREVNMVKTLRTRAQLPAISLEKDGKIIKLVVIYNHRQHFECLMYYILRELNAFDEVIIWKNTTNVKDFEFLDSFLNVLKGEGLDDKFKPYNPDKVSKSVGIGPLYRMCNDPSTLYIKIDDDVVWIAANGFTNLIQFALDNEHKYLMFAGNMVNSGPLDVVHQQQGASSSRLEFKAVRPFTKLLTSEGARQVHESLQKAVVEETTDKYMVDHVYASSEKWSINCIAFFGNLFNEPDRKALEKGDEKYITRKLSNIKNRRIAVPGNALMSHYSFQAQRTKVKLPGRSGLSSFGKERDLLNKYVEWAHAALSN